MLEQLIIRQSIAIGVINIVFAIGCVIIGLFVVKVVIKPISKLIKSAEKIASGEVPEINYISGGMSGSGFASRYWDCCKPSCSWSENAGSGNEAKQCDATATKIITDYSAQSICQGGYASTCLSQIPFTIKGCNNIGFAFAASPGGGAQVCGKCFLLEFTGEGKYETKNNHRALSNKKLIVMSSNIGYDVQSNQFDVMIPGGGVGNFNGCENILGTDLGAIQGGFLSDCENEVGWSLPEEEIYTQRRECLIKKCNTKFSGKGFFII